MDKHARLQARLGYEFQDRALLALALTHRSAGKRNNERLEFLGDSIVNHVVAEALFSQLPDAREGDMSRLRASLVKGDTLAEIGAELGLGEHLVLGSGERKSGGHRRASILADALEAIAGAILLDGGYDRCREVLLTWFERRLDDLDTTQPKDPKTALQEYLQGRGLPLPEYSLESVEGDDHEQVFTANCSLKKPGFSCSGSGGSRRKAEQAAAADALARLHSG